MPAETLDRPLGRASEPRTPSGRLRRSRIGRLREFTLSLDRPEALRYLLERLYPPHGRWERWKLACARRLPWTLAARWALETASRATRTTRRGADEPPLLRELAERPDLLTEAVPGAVPLSWVVRRSPTSADDAHSEIAFFIADGASEPAVVVELQRPGRPGAADEAEALTWLACNLPPALAERVPRLRSHRVQDDLEALALSPIPGPSAYVELRRSGGSPSLARRHLDAAAGWLLPFQRATRSGQPWELPSWERLAPPSESGAPPVWWERLREHLERHPLPRVASHGDFWARNLLPGVGEGASGVVDWRTLRTDASPLDDLFDFALTYGEVLASAGPRGSVAAFLRTFDRQRSFPGDRVWEFVRRVLAGLGVEAGADRWLLAAYLLDRTRRAGSGPPARLGRDRPASFWLECFERSTK